MLRIILETKIQLNNLDIYAYFVGNFIWNQFLDTFDLSDYFDYTSDW